MKYAHLLCLFAVSLPAFPAIAQPGPPPAPSAEAQDAEHPEGIAGTWYAQHLQGEWVPADDEMRLEFRADGTAHFFENDEPDDDVMAYSVDEDRSVIRMVVPEVDIVFEMSYVQFDDVMILTINFPEELGAVPQGENMEIILSRRPEGNEDHQRARAAAGGEDFEEEMRDEDADAGDANAKNPPEVDVDAESRSRVSHLTMGVYVYFVDVGSCPTTLGGAWEYVRSTADYLHPLQDVAEPDDWRAMDEDAKVEWLDAHSAYAYVGDGQAGWAYKNDDAETAIVFALPLFEGTESIAVGLSDGGTEILPYEDADALIEEQTGRDLMGWMEHLGREQLPAPDAAEAGLAGEWVAVSQDGAELSEGELVFTYRADGTGVVVEGGTSAKDYTWAYDAEAQTLHIETENESLDFDVTREGDTLTLDLQGAAMRLVMRRVGTDAAADPSDDDDHAHGHDEDHGHDHDAAHGAAEPAAPRGGHFHADGTYQEGED